MNFWNYFYKLILLPIYIDKIEIFFTDNMFKKGYSNTNSTTKIESSKEQIWLLCSYLFNNSYSCHSTYFQEKGLVSLHNVSIHWELKMNKIHVVKKKKIIVMYCLVISVLSWALEANVVISFIKWSKTNNYMYTTTYKQLQCRSSYNEMETICI